MGIYSCDPGDPSKNAGMFVSDPKRSVIDYEGLHLPPGFPTATPGAEQDGPELRGLKSPQGERIPKRCIKLVSGVANLSWVTVSRSKAKPSKSLDASGF